MELQGLRILEDFWARHRDAKDPLETWARLVSENQWIHFVQCREIFPSADQVKLERGVFTIFNIKGNRYRLVVIIAYAHGTVLIRRVMTHEEYGRNFWKKSI